MNATPDLGCRISIEKKKMGELWWMREKKRQRKNAMTWTCLHWSESSETGKTESSHSTMLLRIHIVSDFCL